MLFSVVSLLAIPTGARALEFDEDVPANIKAQMQDDLQFVTTLESDGLASPLHKEIFGTVSGEVYSKFFESRVKSLGMNSCGGGKAVACVIPYQDDTKMWLTENFVKFSHPQIARLMVVFHEARHTERNSGYHSHATCPTPFKDADGKDMTSIWTGATLAGEPACDTTAYGSYSSSLIMQKNIQKHCMSCNEKVRMDAGIYADDQFKRVISPTAIAKIKKDLYGGGRF